MLPSDLMPIMPGRRVPSRDRPPYQLLSDTGGDSCSNPDDGSGGGCGGGGYCSQGQAGDLPMPGMSVNYCGGPVVWPAGTSPPTCTAAP